MRTQIISVSVLAYIVQAQEEGKIIALSEDERPNKLCESGDENCTSGMSMGMGAGLDGNFDWNNKEELPDKLCSDGNLSCTSPFPLDDTIEAMDENTRPDKLCSGSEWGCGNREQDQSGEEDKSDNFIVNIWDDFLSDSASDLSAIKTSIYVVGSAVLMQALL